MGDSTLFVTAALSGVAALASLAGLLSIIRRRRKASKAAAARGELDSPLYRRVDALLTPSERALYSALRPAAVAQGADVFAKVRLDDVVEVRKGAPDYEARCAAIAALRVGFLLCDRERLVPLLALEIAGDQARNSRRQDADLLERVLNGVGLPLAHVESHTSYDPDVIAAIVHDEIALASAPAGDAAAEATPAEDAPKPPRKPRTGWQAPAINVAWLNEALTPAQSDVGEDGAALGIDEGDEDAADGDVEMATPAEAQESGDIPGLEMAPPAESVPGDEDAAGGDVEMATLAEAQESGDIPGLEMAPPADSVPGDEDAAGGGEPCCPACGSPLVEMEDVESGMVVLACSRYPECPHVQAR